MMFEYKKTTNTDINILTQMHRKLFCELSPMTYKISIFKCRLFRHCKNAFSFNKFAKSKQIKPLPVSIYAYESLIRRKLGNVDMQLQENKAVNLSIACPKVSGVLIKPGETFSFWKLVSSCSRKKGYKEGLIISNGATASGIGGGMCQFTNMIHWLVLHTPLEITEHHHHDGLDLFPDHGRQLPFGVGTSILYNYFDYRFRNTTDLTFQLIVYTTDTHLCGDIRAENSLSIKYHVNVKNEYFSKEIDGYYRNNTIFRKCINSHTGNLIENKLIKENHAKIMYDSKYLPSDKIIEQL